MKLLIIAILLIAVVFLGAFLYLQHPKFGPDIDASRLPYLQGSANYNDGEFHNLEPTAVLSDGNSTLSIIMERLLGKPENLRPPAALPTRKIDLKSLDINQDIVIWLGHSSYFVQLSGQRILIDPVFSRYAAPMPYANEAFEGSIPYSAEDMPEIDYLLITHDHWDHLDYPSIIELQSKIRHVVCGLGVDRYFLHWGYSSTGIQAADWFTSVTTDSGITLHVLPARHYSGRLMTKNQTLWVSFALETPDLRLYFGGDSGYGKHIARIAEMFEDFDLAVLDMGQYDARWPNIHMTPEQAAQTAEELHARSLLPAHVGKFTISDHAWDEPFKRIVEASEGRSYRLLTPMIGQPVDLATKQQSFDYWWTKIK